MARAVCASCGARIRAKDRFCPECGTPIAAAQAPPRPDAAASAAQQSASLQVPLASSRALAEQRKIVTILFADLSGSTPLAEKLDPEDLRGILGRYFNALARQIQRYEGTIDKYIGDAIMCVFGAPISHEDDAERAIRSALAMQTAIQRLNDDLEREHGVRLALRIGVNTGEVVAGMLGGDAQQSYTVVGDAVNTAQRFESVAPLNEILVSETTRRLAIHSFEFETLPPVTLKGKAQPVAAYRVLRPRDEEIPPEASPLVGREGEMERLRAALGAALTGTGQNVAILGEAGVGKSRLLGEFKANLVAGIERLSARCASYETNTPYALIAHLVRGAFRMHETHDEARARVALTQGFARFGATLEVGALALLLEVLGYGEVSSLEAERKPAALVRILRDLLATASEQTSFVIGAEDLHWVDAPSAAVLAELARSVPALPCLFIATARRGWKVPWQAEVIDLAPLEALHARELIEELLERPAGDALATRILERTGGNPFFIEEVVRTVRETSGADVPQSVQEVLEARIERLADGPTRALQSAAVVGVTFWYRVLERLLTDEPVSAHVAELEGDGFIAATARRPEPTYAFRQALVQEVAYQTQLLSERRRAHRSVGEVIEDLFGERIDEFTDLLAYHYERGDDPARALRWLVRAGDRAGRLFANEEALARYASALTRASDGTGEHDAGSILERVGDIETLTGKYDAAIATYAQARERSGPQPSAVARARLERKVAFTHTRSGNYVRAEELLRSALVTIGQSRDEELAAIWLDLAQAIWRQDRFDDAIDAARRGIAAAEAVGAVRSVAHGHRNLGLVYMWKGERSLAAEHLHRALELYRSIDDTVGVMSGHGNLGILYRRLGRYAEALEQYEQALALARRVGDAWVMATVLGNAGEVHRYQRELERALASYEASLATWQLVGDPIGVALMRMNIGILRAEQGEGALAREALLSALGEFERLGSRRFLPELYRTLAALELASDPGAAAEWARRSLEVAREIRARDDEAVALRTLGEVQAAAGDLAAAEAALKESIDVLRAAQDRLELARSLQALAKVLRDKGDAAEAAERAAEAEALAKE